MEDFFQLDLLFQVTDINVIEEFIITNHKFCECKLIKIRFVQTFCKHNCALFYET